MNDKRENKLASQVSSTGEATQPDVLPTIDNCQIDRLVDGELTEAERRELLLALDRHPDGWRRCALAFLEAQCFRAELSAIGKMAYTGTKMRPTPATAAAGMPKTKAWPWLVRTAAGFAMAASLLAAMMLGAAWQQWRSGAALIAKQDMAGNSAGPTGFGAEQLEPFGHLAPQPESAVSRAAQRWQTVTISLQGGTDSPASAIQLPVREHDDFEETLLDELPASVPPDIWEGLESFGCRVVQHRQLLTLPLGDGRTLVVPVDSVELSYVGQQEH